MLTATRTATDRAGGGVSSWPGIASEGRRRFRSPMPGHPRLSWAVKAKTWMPGTTSPGMTSQMAKPDFAALPLQFVACGLAVNPASFDGKLRVSEAARQSAFVHALLN